MLNTKPYKVNIKWVNPVLNNKTQLYSRHQSIFFPSSHKIKPHPKKDREKERKEKKKIDRSLGSAEVKRPILQLQRQSKLRSGNTDNGRVTTRLINTELQGCKHKIKPHISHIVKNREAKAKM